MKLHSVTLVFALIVVGPLQARATQYNSLDVNTVRKTIVLVLATIH